MLLNGFLMYWWCIAQRVSGCIAQRFPGVLGVCLGVLGCLLIERCRFAPTVAASLLRSSAAPGASLGYVC